MVNSNSVAQILSFGRLVCPGFRDSRTSVFGGGRVKTPAAEAVRSYQSGGIMLASLPSARSGDMRLDHADLFGIAQPRPQKVSM